MPLSSQSPLISVVIPTRDTRDLTLACLASLSSRTAGGKESIPADSIEVLVVDDASHDDTVATIERRFPKVQILRNERSSGFTVSANRGLTAARGTFFFLLNSDTEVPARSLVKLVEAFQAEKGLGIAGASLRYPDGSSQWSGGPRPSSAWLFALSSGLASFLGRLPGYRALRPVRGSSQTVTAVDWVTGAAMMIRATVWDALGPLDERFDFYCQDLDYCLRAGRRGWTIRVIPEAHVVHHHGATVTRMARMDGPDVEKAVAESPDGMKPRLLWRDLLRWSYKEEGLRGLRRSARILELGTRLRLVARSLRRLLIAPSLRPMWDARSDEFRQALAEIERARETLADRATES